VGIGSAAYKLVFVLHLMTAIVGFGGVMLNGVYGSQAKKRPGPGGLAIGEANLAVTEIATKVILAVPILGILLVVMSDGVWKFSQMWVGIAIVLFIALYAFAMVVQHKNQERMTELAGELVAAGPPAGGASGPPPQVAQMEALEKKLAAGGAALSLAVVVMVCLMVFKPGL
jgi:uncharacterized membrane protein